MQAVILIGLPGAGKTTWSRAQFPHAIHCSVDHFFEKEGEYKFDPRGLPQANAECMKRFIEVCRWQSDATTSTLNDIVVDNTNCNVHSIAPYIGIAKAYGITVRLVMVRDPGNAFARCIHKVPEQHWYAMKLQLNEMLAKWPTIWGNLETVFSEAP